jgi:hypothetical protein
MIDEQRDPELESMRAEWEPPPPSAGFPARVLSAFDREFGRVPWWQRRWPVAAVVVAAAGLAIAVVITRPNGPAGYQPVSQPHFTIISAGEHP